MPQLTTSGVVRDILTADLALSADEVIRRAKAKGIKGADAVIRTTVHNVRSELKKKAARPAPAAARTTVAPAPTAAAQSDLTGVLANVALVNSVVGACGGVEAARKAAEAVRACGGVDAFLLHLDLVAGIRTADATH